MVAPAVPELTEDILHESIDARTDTLGSLRELGPPDLVHLSRHIARTGKQASIYHHVTGVDASSSASLAAYINTLTYGEQGPQAQTKIVAGLYCCYNAFSRIDMRVHVTIPGSVDAYYVNEQGKKFKATKEHWLETFLCGILRAYSYADNGSGETIRKIIGVRRFNPITNPEAEDKFMNAVENLFFRGWQLGSEPVVQIPNLVSNHLTTGLLKYFKSTGRCSSGIKLFSNLRAKNVEVSSLLAKLLFMGNEEVQGVRVLHQALQERPMDYVMLDTQAEFLLTKAHAASSPEQKEERLRMARDCADRSTVAAPSEFGTWARLARVYVAMEDWEKALTTLNSCPMFHYQEKDSPTMPEPKETFLPILVETRLDDIDHEPEGRQELDPNLLNLRGAAYKGTFKAAYSILTEMTAKIGWDQLLKIRSNVFVMEDEYRSEKIDSGRRITRTASTDGIRGSLERETGAVNGVDSPTDSSGNAEKRASTPDGAPEADSVEKPAQIVAAADTDGTTDSPATKAADEESVEAGVIHPQGARTGQPLSKLNNKRLCERWLDACFMVLYEDLRVYTIWRTQMAQYRAQSMNFRKSADEWEMLGTLAERLQHSDEAVEAYRACLSQRFSPKALTGLLRVYERSRSSRETIASVIRLVTWQYRWYSEFSPELLATIRNLIEEEGAVKVRSIIQASNVPQNVLDLTHRYAALCATFRSGGMESYI